MPAKDAIHDAVKNALVKDGWTITHDPFVIEFENTNVFADLAADRAIGAEYAIAAERGVDRIVVEAKSFAGASPVRDFQQAVGQYEMYSTLLDLKSIDRKLYLALGLDIFELHFEAGAIGSVAKRLGIPLLVIDIDKEEVVRWTS